MQITHAISLDFQRYKTPSQIDVSQDDTYSRYIKITLFNNMAEWPVPDGVTVAVRFKKSDRTQGVYDTLPNGTVAYSVEGNTITVGVAPQMLTVKGKVTASVVVFLGSAQLATFPFVLNVVENPAAGQSISNDYYYLQTWDDINNAIGDLGNLQTDDKSSLVAAINALADEMDRGQPVVIFRYGKDPLISIEKAFFLGTRHIVCLKDGVSYLLTACDETKATFHRAGDGCIEEVSVDANDNWSATQTPVGGGGGTGLSSTEKNLMLTLFKAVPYTSDVSATMKSLEAIWNSSGSGDSGGEAVTSYEVTYNLTNVTADNSTSSIVEGGSLTVNLTPDTNAVLGEVTVTMGGEDITATAYSNGKISISSVTGDVVITATATVANYTQVEYLESADTSAYMVTPVTLRPTDLVECVWTNFEATQWAFPFGAFANGVHCSLTTRPDGAAGRTAYTRRNGATYTNRNAADPDFIMPKPKAMYRFAESAPGTGTIYDADGNALVTLTDENVSSYTGNGCRLGLFWIVDTTYAAHGNPEVSGLRIHSFKITDAYGSPTLDLIPVLDANNVPCMYDKVSGEYLYDASGANTFVAGGAM